MPQITDWRKTAAAVAPSIPKEELEKIVPVLEALEAAFTPLRQTIPAGAPVWTGPEEKA